MSTETVQTKTTPTNFDEIFKDAKTGRKKYDEEYSLKKEYFRELKEMGN